VRVFCIINPIAGTKLRSVDEALLHEVYADRVNELEIHESKAKSHCRSLAKQAVDQGFDVVVVAGGDGTLNEACAPLLNSKIKMLIVPVGSGNGLAHHLQLPFKPRRALELLFSENSQKIDVGVVDNEDLGKEYFLSNAGMGYDAQVIHAYDKLSSRGFATYIYCMFKTMFSLKPPSLQITFNENDWKLKPFVFTVANSSQYGYRIKVAPHADISDGKLDSLLVRDATFLRVLRFSLLSAFNRMDKVDDVAEFEEAKDILVRPQGRIQLQIDGEAFFTDKPIQFSVLHRALDIILPQV